MFRWAARVRSLAHSRARGEEVFAYEMSILYSVKPIVPSHLVDRYVNEDTRLKVHSALNSGDSKCIQLRVLTIPHLSIFFYVMGMINGR